MNQTAIGGYIARKRKEQNLTQEQLAQQLGVSNKTISKWENGKCMPDYSIIQRLCDAIHVTLPELMDGEDAAENSVHVYDNEQILGIASGAMSKDNRRNGCTGLLLRYPHGSVRRRNSGRHLGRRKEAPEAAKKPAACETAGDWLMLGYYSMAIAVEEASFFTSSFGTMTLRTPSSYFALTSSGLTLPT